MKTTTAREDMLHHAIKDMLNGLYWDSEEMKFETELKGKYTDIYEAVNKLSKKQRFVIYYRFWGGNDAKWCNGNQGGMSTLNWTKIIRTAV